MMTLFTVYDRIVRTILQLAILQLLLLIYFPVIHFNLRIGHKGSKAISRNLHNLGQTYV